MGRLNRHEVRARAKTFIQAAEGMVIVMQANAKTIDSVTTRAAERGTYDAQDLEDLRAVATSLRALAGALEEGTTP
jgi:hypothetical protein